VRYGHQEEDKRQREEPHEAKKRDGETFVKISPVNQLKDNEWKHKDQADHRLSY
jgi:hypothetical protein